LLTEIENATVGNNLEKMAVTLPPRGFTDATIDGMTQAELIFSTNVEC